MHLLDAFIERLKHPSNVYKTLFHFTSASNLASIRANGLLSQKLLKDMGIVANFPGGDATSQASDTRLGNNVYVSVSLTPNHPMADACRNDSRQPDQVYIPIAPDVLRTPGSIICLGMANSSMSPRLSIPEGLTNIPFELLYTRHGRPFSEIKAIIMAVRKYEILIPMKIDPSHLGHEFPPRR